MLRKVIKQGNGGSTIFLPHEWVKEHNLQAGSEVIINKQGQQLTISAKPEKKTKKAIRLILPDTNELAIRIPITNAYRAGFDKILVQYPGSEEKINNLVETRLIGFEIDKKKKDNYIIESVSEPSYENFDNIIHRQFHILAHIINDFFDKDIEKNVSKLKRYDNFLKRCISQKKLQPSYPQLWQLLSYIANIARLFLHFQRDIKKNNMKITRSLEDFIKKFYEMVILLRSAYLKNDSSRLHALDTIEQKFQKNKEKEFLKKIDKKAILHLRLITRALYLAKSPLIGIIQLKDFEGSKFLM